MVTTDADSTPDSVIFRGYVFPDAASRVAAGEVEHRLRTHFLVSTFVNLAVCAAALVLLLLGGVMTGYGFVAVVVFVVLFAWWLNIMTRLDGAESAARHGVHLEALHRLVIFDLGDVTAAQLSAAAAAYRPYVEVQYRVDLLESAASLTHAQQAELDDLREERVARLAAIRDILHPA